MLGSPIRHSLSPALHRAAYAALGLDGWTYDAHEVTGEELAGFLDGLDSSWVGLSLTMPLKQAVLPLLDGQRLVDDPAGPLDDTVTATGSCNTVLLATSGGRRGYNTDVVGIVAAVREAASPGVAGPGDPGRGAHEGVAASAAPLSRVVVLGAGATAASAVLAAARLGAVELAVAVREPARAAGTVATATAVGLPVHVVRLGGSEAAAAIPAADLVVSTLPAGVADPVADLVADRPPRGTLLDVVYEPWPTALAAAWTAAGRPVVPGDAMLLHQAAAQVRLMTGCEAPVAAMRAGMAAERAARLSCAGETD